MTRFLAFLLLSIAFVAGAGAQKPAEGHWYSIPSCYTPEGGGVFEIGKDAPCNKGKEKFNAFLKRFGTDSKFRMDRLMPATAMSEIIPDYRGLECAVKAMDEMGFMPFRGHSDRLPEDIAEESCNEYSSFGCFYRINRDSVVYSCWECLPDTGEDNGSAVVLFERLDGKWYLTDVYPFGKLWNPIRRMLENPSE